MFPNNLKVFEKKIIVDESCIDVLNHTNNKVYLQWMEEAALEHSSALGWSIERYLQYQGGFVAAGHYMEFHRPTFLNDQLTMYTWVQNMESKRSLRRFTLVRDKKVCFIGATQWSFVSFVDGRSRDIPKEVAEAFPILNTDDPVFTEIGVNLRPDYPLDAFCRQ